MKRLKGCRVAFVLTFFFVGLTAGTSYGEYQVWQCGLCNEFNCQGYDTSPMIQFYPFGHKVDDYYRINLDATRVLALNPAVGGGYFGYMMWRIDNAPVLWLSLDGVLGLIDWDILFNTCSYDVDTTLQCVDFEDPASGSTYGVGSVLNDSGQSVTFTAFQLSTGGYTSGGFAEVVPQDVCDAGGSGQSLLVNNINVQFGFPTLDDGLTIQFRESGGNVNIEVNGDFRNELNFDEVVSPVGGVAFSCAGFGCSGSGEGILYLVGTVTSLRIGGQEFCMDNVCPRIGD